MLELLAVILIISFVISYLIARDIFHPAVIVSGLWMVLINMYVYIDHPLYHLSDKFCVALSLWVLPFVVLSLLGGRLFLSTGVYEYYEDPPKIDMYIKLYPYMILFSFLFIAGVLFYAGYSFFDIRNFLVEESNTFPPPLKLLFYISTFFIVYVAYGMLNYEYLGLKKIVILLLCLFIVSIFKSNKTSFLQLFIMLIFIYKYKFGSIKIKNVLGFVVGTALFLILVTINRGDLDTLSGGDNPLLTFFYVYLLSPLPSFDLLLNDSTVLAQGASGSGTFVFFYNVFNALGANFSITELGTWVSVPVPNNVFTVMRGYYLDWGMLGIFIMSCVMAVIWAWLYARQVKNDRLYVLFYALMVSALTFQSFGDYFWYNLSNTIQYFVFAYILTRRFSVSIDE